MHGLVGGKKKRGPTERVTVIGLGRFGSSVARTLNELGYEVTAIDRDPKRIQEMADHVTLAAQGDGTDQELLQQLNVDQSDVAIVAQGENLEASLLSTLLLKKLKIPWVIGKARNSLHGELLRKVGADRADSSQDAVVHGVERCIRQALVDLGRRVPTYLVFRAMAIIAVYLAVHFLFMMMLAFTEDVLGPNNLTFLDLMLEAMSAAATAGLTTGITLDLSDAGKVVLCGAMFFGRLGPLTLVYALTQRQRTTRYHFLEAPIRMG